MPIKIPRFGGGGGVFGVLVGERQSIAQREFALLTPEIHRLLDMAKMLQKISVRAHGLSADECEHPFV